MLSVRFDLIEAIHLNARKDVVVHWQCVVEVDIWIFLRMYWIECDFLQSIFFPHELNLGLKSTYLFTFLFFSSSSSLSVSVFLSPLLVLRWLLCCVSFTFLKQNYEKRSKTHKRFPVGLVRCRCDNGLGPFVPFSFRQPPTSNWHKISWINCVFFSLSLFLCCT